jgi:hypothetical protein
MIPADVVESTCGRDFLVDSRNENLPEKCIHQNCASRPGCFGRRVLLKIRRDAPKPPARGAQA